MTANASKLERDGAAPVVSLPLGMMGLALGLGPIVLGGLMVAAAWPKYGIASVDAIVGAAVVGVISLISVGVLRVLGPRPMQTAALAFMFVSCARLIAAMAIALGLYLLREPAVVPFWIGFLGAGLASLAAESLISAQALRAAAGRPQTDHSDHAKEDHA